MVYHRRHHVPVVNQPPNGKRTTMDDETRIEVGMIKEGKQMVINKKIDHMDSIMWFK